MKIKTYWNTYLQFKPINHIRMIILRKPNKANI